MRAHLGRYTFNNLEVLLHRDRMMSLEVDDLFDKIVIRQRGGYCFEHNKLMYEVLLHLGFSVKPLLGRVLFGEPGDMPRTHRVTRVTLEGQDCLVDVGFGPYSPTAMIPFNGEQTECPHGGIYRIVQTDPQNFHLERLQSSGFMVLYSFDTVTYTEADYKVANFYSSKHPDATFVQELRVSLVEPERILSLRDLTLSIIGQEYRQRIEITGASDLQRIMQDYFDTALTDEECQRLYDRQVAHMASR